MISGGVYVGGLLGRGELPISVLDRAVPDKPMLIIDSVGHGAWVNTKALQAVGYDKLEEQPQGGLVHRDSATGQLSGVVFENAYQQLQDIAWQPVNWKLEESANGLRVALSQLAENGITTVSDAGGYWPRGHDNIWYQLKGKEMTVRASNALYVYPDKPFDEQIKELEKRFSNDVNA